MTSANPGDSGMLQSNDLWAVRAAVDAEAVESANAGGGETAPGGSAKSAAPAEPHGAGSAAEPSATAEPAFVIDRQDVVVQLDFLRQAIRILEVPDPFGPEFAVATGAWKALPPAADAWRAAASGLHPSMSSVAEQAGGIDGCWDGADSDAFVAQLRRIGERGGELADAVTALADALDAATESLRVLGREMRELVAAVAEPVHLALREPDSDLPAAREHLMRIRRPAAGLAESVNETVAALARFCTEQEEALPSAPDLAPVSGSPLWTNVGGVEASPGSPEPPAPAQPVPAQPVPAQPAPAEATPADVAPAAEASRPSVAAMLDGEAPATAAPEPAGTDAAQADDPDATNGAEAATAAGPTAAATGGAMAGGGMVGGMMPMAGMAGSGGGAERRPKRPRPKADPSELFGAPVPATEPVLGDTKKKQQE
ncbi:hypothetical protein [Saccharopolyspora gloriosae]|uniref:hypothetical protein n=1 Tax=Saccharopolyspora gloriosae TaxID=455344 RepID=UPI001FB5AD61|nr:hypothetical protein [Saccharopolyspora gloriosae]